MYGVFLDNGEVIYLDKDQAEFTSNSIMAGEKHVQIVATGNELRVLIRLDQVMYIKKST